MEEKFVQKMIMQTFLQYKHDRESVPVTEEEFKELFIEVKEVKALDPEADLHDIINDVVYEYLTK